MINFYSSNFIPIKKPFNQIHPERESNPSNQSKQRASSINIDKIKSQAKVLPYNSVIKKTNNHVLKSISVNKQIQYQKYNGISAVKSNYNNTNNINTNNKNSKSYLNMNDNTNPKNERVSQINKINNYSNNKLRRKMILSVDINNKKNVKNISQYDLNNNIKFITDVQSDNNKISENNPSNPMSNGAKNNNNSKNINNNKIVTKSKSISVNHITKNWSQNNLMKSPDRKYNTNALNKYMESSDKKERNSKNSKKTT